MTPSLSQVLLQGGPAANPSLNPLFLLAGLTVCFLAAFSAVKSLELFRRRRLLPQVLNEAPSLAEIQNKEEAEKLTFMIDEMKNEKKTLAVQNAQLQGRVQELNDVLNNVKQTRDTLEKSNVAFLKESTRLKAEKEELLLQASEPLIKTTSGSKFEGRTTQLIAIDPKSKKKKSKAVKLKAVKAVKIKKGERGRPGRVRKKVK
jgi:phage-related minor tail protein